MSRSLRYSDNSWWKTLDIITSKIFQVINDSRWVSGYFEQFQSPALLVTFFEDLSHSTCPYQVLQRRILGTVYGIIFVAENSTTVVRIDDHFQYFNMSIDFRDLWSFVQIFPLPLLLNPTLNLFCTRYHFSSRIFANLPEWLPTSICLHGDGI